jgi:hypothetical protein
LKIIVLEKQYHPTRLSLSLLLPGIDDIPLYLASAAPSNLLG